MFNHLQPGDTVLVAVDSESTFSVDRETPGEAAKGEVERINTPTVDGHVGSVRVAFGDRSALFSLNDGKELTYGTRSVIFTSPADYDDYVATATA